MVDSAQRVVYIGGTGRSGTTLLELMLAGLPGAFPVGELCFIWEYGVRDDGRCGCGKRFSGCDFWGRVGEVAYGGWDRLDVDAMIGGRRSFEHVRHLPLYLAPSPRPALRRRIGEYAERTARLYGAIKEVSGCSYIIESSKEPVRPLLLSRLPSIELGIAHIVRDPRGVAYSRLRARRRRRATESSRRILSSGAAMWWTHNLPFSLLGARGVPVASVRYEDLVSEPRARLVELLDRLHVPTRLPDGYLVDRRLHPERNHTVTGNKIRIPRPMTLSVDDEWRVAMPGGAQRLVTAITWPLLWKYGYLRPSLLPRRRPSRPPHRP